MLTDTKMTSMECWAWIRRARSTLRLAERKMPSDPNYLMANTVLDNAERLLAVGALERAHVQLTEASRILTAVGERAAKAIEQLGFRSNSPTE